MALAPGLMGSMAVGGSAITPPFGALSSFRASPKSATPGKPDAEDAAREAAGNWRSWTCFVWDREREIDDAENWSIVYTHNRDSGLLAQSNAAAIADVLRPFSETENPDVVFESHPHWAVGHVDGRARRVRRCNGPGQSRKRGNAGPWIVRDTLQPRWFSGSTSRQVPSMVCSSEPT